jgi:PhnB protein
MASRASTKSKASKSAGRGAGKAAAKSGTSKPAKKAVRAAPKAAPVKSTAKTKKATNRTALIAQSAQKTAQLKAQKTAAKSARKTAIKAASRKRAATAPAPSVRHTVTPFLNVKGAEDAIEFYKRAFGAEERLRMPNADGSIMHAELVIGDSTIMLSEVTQRPESRSSIHLSVADCDALFQRAVSAGGLERMAPQDMFWGERYGQVEDPFGNLWSIATHTEDVPADELSRRAAEMAATMAAAPQTEPVADLGMDPV